MGWRDVQSVKCLLYKHEDLSSSPQNPQKKSGDVAFAFNSSAKATEPSGSLGFTSQPQLMRTCIKKPKWMAGTPYLTACTVCSRLSHP